MSLWFFFQECRNIWTKLCQIQPHPPPLPLCPSPNKNVESRSLRAKTPCMCLLRYWREIEGGELSRMCLKPCFPACGKKKALGHFLSFPHPHNKVLVCFIVPLCHSTRLCIFVGSFSLLPFCHVGWWHLLFREFCVQDSRVGTVGRWTWHQPLGYRGTILQHLPHGRQ